VDAKITIYFPISHWWKTCSYNQYQVYNYTYGMCRHL